MIGWLDGMIRAVLFDLGGTLDGGVHWLDRFAALYADAGVALPRETIRAAFDEAERRAGVDAAIASAPLAPMVAQHLDWQLAHLQHADATIAERIDRGRFVAGFVAPVRAAAARNVRVLADLAARGLRLGVVSNGCGNVDALCCDLGFSDLLSTIVDSRRVGLSKPDPAIFLHAAASLGVQPRDALMVGDSFDRDIRPAKSVGMSTAWLAGPGDVECPDPASCDLRLRTLDELPAALEPTVARAATAR